MPIIELKNFDDISAPIFNDTTDFTMQENKQQAGCKRSFAQFEAQHASTASEDAELVSFLDTLNEDGYFFYENQQQENHQPQPQPQPLRYYGHNLPPSDAPDDLAKYADDVFNLCRIEPLNEVPSFSTGSHKLENRRFSGISCYSDKTINSYDSSLTTTTTTTIAAPVTVTNKNPTAMEIFSAFIRRSYNEHGEQVVDVSGLVSRPCYEAWLASRKRVPNKPEECFRKSLLAHISCSDGGSASFSPEVEAALLVMLRKPGKVWPCFAGRKDKNGKKLLLGIKGLRAIGFHERQRIGRSGLEITGNKKAKFA